MPKTSPDRALRLAILTVSDRAARGERPDATGPTLAEAIREQGWKIVYQQVLPDEQELIEETLRQWCDSGVCDVVLTSGGTGFSPRDVTPEATQAVVERLAPGLAEAMRLSSRQFTPHAMLSRAVAGIRKQALIVNLPGSSKAAVENLQVILPVLPHAVQLLQASVDAESGHLLNATE